jgi:WD40 repeat protein
MTTFDPREHDFAVDPQLSQVILPHGHRSADTAIRVWDPEREERLLHTLYEHRRPVQALHLFVSEEGRYRLVSGGDRTLLWDFGEALPRKLLRSAAKTG